MMTWSVQVEMAANRGRTGRAAWRRAQARAGRLVDRLPVRESQKLLLLTFLIGGLGGLAAVAFHRLLDAMQDGLIYRIASSPGSGQVFWLIAVPALGGLAAGAALHFYAPEARGSGIPQVKTAYVVDRGRIPARVIPAKMLLPAISIGTGASLGREGPTVQICAAIASFLGRAFRVSPARLRSLVPVGAAAGLAAAFNTPIAAVTFTLEEIMGDTAAGSMGSIVIASVVASVVERSLLGEHALFSVPAYRLNGVAELPFYLALGLAAGLAAAAFNSSLLRVRGWFTHQDRIPAWATPGAGGLLVGVLGVSGLLMTGSASVFGVGYEQLAVGLRGDLPLKVMAVLGLLKLAATVVSYGSGASGGIFGPSLFIGGMLGGAVGLGAALVLPGGATEPGAFALVGMGAVFAGIVRAPITSIVMIFEMTNNYSIILPLMAANITSFAVARRLVREPIYDALLEQDGIHLPKPGGHHLRRLRVGSAMSRSFVALDARSSTAGALLVVRASDRPGDAHPLLDADGRFVGMVSRRELERAEREGRGEEPVLGLARAPSIALHADQSVDAALAALGRQQSAEMPVVSRRDSGRLVGIVTLGDVAAAVARAEDRAG